MVRIQVQEGSFKDLTAAAKLTPENRTAEAVLQKYMALEGTTIDIPPASGADQAEAMGISLEGQVQETQGQSVAIARGKLPIKISVRILDPDNKHTLSNYVLGSEEEKIALEEIQKQQLQFYNTVVNALRQIQDMGLADYGIPQDTETGFLDKDTNSSPYQTAAVETLVKKLGSTVTPARRIAAQAQKLEEAYDALNQLSGVYLDTVFQNTNNWSYEVEDIADILNNLTQNPWVEVTARVDADYLGERISAIIGAMGQALQNAGYDLTETPIPEEGGIRSLIRPIPEERGLRSLIETLGAYTNRRHPLDGTEAKGPISNTIAAKVLAQYSVG